MPQLDFPNFFQKIVKPFSSLNQQKSFNILFSTDSDSVDYSSSLISRYVNGKKPLPTDLILFICQLDSEILINRLQMLFQDPVPCQKVAYKMVLDSSLSSLGKETLISSYNSGNSFNFLEKVFKTSIKFNSKEYTNNLQDYVKTISDSSEHRGDIKNIEVIESFEFSDFLKWLDSINIYHKPEQQPGYTMPYIKQYNLILPKDVVPLMYFAYRSCFKADILGLNIEDFYTSMHLNPVTMIPQEGEILFYEVRANNGELAAAIISEANFPMADSIIYNIQYGENNITTQTMHSIEKSIHSKAGDGAKVFYSMTANDRASEYCYIEMLFHVPRAHKKFPS